MKAATNAVHGPFVELRRAARCWICPSRMTTIAVAHRERFLLVVGHVDEGDADLALERLELELHLLAELEVERAQRLVEEEAPWES